MKSESNQAIQGFRNIDKGIYFLLFETECVKICRIVCFSFPKAV